MHLSLDMRRITLIVGSILLATWTCIARTDTRSSEPPVVGYCDLISNPDAYNGKEIRLRAEYQSGFETSFFFDSKCVKRLDPKKIVWVEFDDLEISKNTPEIVKRFHDVLYRPETDKDGRMTSRWWTWYVKLQVVGLFQTATDSTGGFGHMGGYAFMLTVSRIENVGKLKKQRPRSNVGA